MASWTTWIVSTRATVGHAEPLAPALLAFIRFGTAAALLSPYWWQLRGLPKGKSPWLLFGLMFAGIPYLGAVLVGLKYAPATEAGPLLTGTLPLFVGALSAFLLGERFSRLRLVGLSGIAMGTFAIIGHSMLEPESGHWIGHLFVLIGAMSWSIYTIAFRKSGLSAVQAASLVGLWSVIVLLPFAASDIWHAIETTAVTAIVQQIAIQGLLAGVLALILFTSAVAYLGPSRTTAITAITPVTALTAAAVWLGETPNQWGIAGCGAIVLGVLLASGVIDEWVARRAGR
ncbi:DMT family transporter [Pseudomonas sp. Marseille-QA0892]